MDEDHYSVVTTSSAAETTECGSPDVNNNPEHHPLFMSSLPSNWARNPGLMGLAGIIDEEHDEKDRLGDDDMKDAESSDDDNESVDR